MRRPALKERLIDSRDAERSAVAHERAELEQSIKTWQLDYPEESPEEKARRMSIHDTIDTLVIIGCGIVVAMSVISCAAAIWFSSSETFELLTLEVLFAVSIIQGPFAMYQRLQLAGWRSLKEAIATLWNDTKSLKLSNYLMNTDIVKMQEHVERLRLGLSRYESFMVGYGIHEFSDLYYENKRINEEKKQLAEAIGLEKLIKSILETDSDKDHYIGDAELRLLAQRTEWIEGVRFTSEEMCERFRQEETRSLRQLADVVGILYIEKRREQVEAKAVKGLEKSPRNLGTPWMWKRKLDGIGITV